jgi:hypothetical protein
VHAHEAVQVVVPACRDRQASVMVHEMLYREMSSREDRGVACNDAVHVLKVV